MNLEYLPEELLQRILQEVSHGDLCRLASTSHKLYWSATTPSLWTRCPLSKDQLSLHGVHSFSLLPRFSQLAVLNLGGTSFNVKEYSLVCSFVVSSRLVLNAC